MIPEVVAAWEQLRTVLGGLSRRDRVVAAHHAKWISARLADFAAALGRDDGADRAWNLLAPWSDRQPEINRRGRKLVDQALAEHHHEHHDEPEEGM